MIQHAKWHISCDSVFRIRSERSSLSNHTTPRFGPCDSLPSQSRIFSASWIDVSCTPSLVLRISWMSAPTTEGPHIWDGPMPMGTTRSGQQPLVPLQFCGRRDSSPKDGLVELLEECLGIRAPSFELAFLQRLLRHARSFRCEHAAAGTGPRDTLDARLRPDDHGNLFFCVRIGGDRQS